MLPQITIDAQVLGGWTFFTLIMWYTVYIGLWLGPTKIFTKYGISLNTETLNWNFTVMGVLKLHSFHISAARYLRFLFISVSPILLLDICPSFLSEFDGHGSVWLSPTEIPTKAVMSKYKATYPVSMCTVSTDVIKNRSIICSKNVTASVCLSHRLKRIKLY